MQKKISMVLVGVALAGCQMSEPTSSNVRSANSQTACTELVGTWVGNKVGSGYEGAVTIPMNADCTYEWLGTNGRITTGRLRSSGDGFSYSNSAGSRGVVSITGNTMKWNNIYTGNNYEVTVRR